MINKDIINTVGSYETMTDIQLLFSAHRWLKKHFSYTSESVQYPAEVETVWDIWRPVFLKVKNKTTLVGDCDDFMLKLLTILYYCGYPLNRLWLVCAHAPTGEGHAIPLIETSKGVFQADNMLNEPIPS